MQIIDQAIEFATLAHRHQLRKGTNIPYISHPFAVGILLVRAGCTQEVVAAGLLHDTIEDASVTLGELRERFGDRVAAIVEGCSEADKSSPWEVRKQHTLEALRTASSKVRLVSCADKLHNVRSMATDFERVGEALWARFKRGRDSQAWYYRGLVESLRPPEGDEQQLWLHRQLEQEVQELFGKA